MVMSPVGLGTKNDCAGEDQQQFTRPTDHPYEMDEGAKPEILQTNDALPPSTIKCLSLSS
jgi:hypothetical protein